MTPEFKSHVISFIQTFLATLLLLAGEVVTGLTGEQIADANFWKGGAAVALLLAILRSAVRVAWETTLPKAIGGK